jgi:hypothetical protein
VEVSHPVTVYVIKVSNAYEPRACPNYYCDTTAPSGSLVCVPVWMFYSEWSKRRGSVNAS